ncbi:hypothetical protein [Arthrobacter sp. UYCo732]|uniref:hypothetical protein n=1 Tax=Arthrobacter sp. UYCo732 TaxID=3156336 RepID=UPI003391787D
MSEGREAYHAAGRLSRAARDLMQSADEIDRPSDSYSIVGNVLDSLRSLEVTLGQLMEWHRAAEAGRHFEEDHDESTIGIMTAVTELDLAVQQADGLQETVSRAYGGNAVVRWFDSDQDDEDTADGPSEHPGSFNREDIIQDAQALLDRLDDTAPTEMDAMFYQSGYDALELALRDLLKVVEHGDRNS